MHSKTENLLDSGSDDFADLIRRVQNGSEAAAWLLVEKYGTYVIRTIRRTLRRDLRAKFDSQDFAQAVWGSFFDCEKQLGNVQTPNQLISMLATMARNKVIDEGRRRSTEKYDVTREQSLEDTNQDSVQMAGNPGTPSQCAMVREEWDQILSEQPEKHRAILQMRLTGMTQDAIAEKLNLSKKTVQRVLMRMRQRQLQ